MVSVVQNMACFSPRSLCKKSRSQDKQTHPRLHVEVLLFSVCIPELQIPLPLFLWSNSQNLSTSRPQSKPNHLPDQSSAAGLHCGFLHSDQGFHSRAAFIWLDAGHWIVGFQLSQACGKGNCCNECIHLNELCKHKSTKDGMGPILPSLRIALEAQS